MTTHPQKEGAYREFSEPHNRMLYNIYMKQAGLTLIELIVTLAVVSSLLAMGIPQLQSSAANNRLTTSINKLIGDLAFARTEAIKRGVRVSVSSANTDWATSGWTVAENGSGTPSIRISPLLTGGAKLTTNPASTSITFNPDGRSTAVVAFSLCDSRTGINSGKIVTLNTTGQTFLQTGQGC